MENHCEKALGKEIGCWKLELFSNRISSVFNVLLIELRFGKSLKVRKSKIFHVFLASVVLGSSVCYAKLYFFHLMVVFLFCIAMLNFKPQLNVKVQSKLTISGIMLLFSVLWYFCSFFWSINVVYSLRYLFYLIIGGSIPYILVLNVDSILKFENAFRVLRLFFFLEILLAIIEIFTGYHLPTSPFSSFAPYFGRASLSIGEDGNPISPLLMRIPFGFHSNPNDLALVLGCLLPFFLLAKSKLSSVFGSITIFSLVICCASRGVLLASMFGIFLFFIFFFPLKALKKYFGLTFIAVFLFTAVGGFQNIQNGPLISDLFDAGYAMFDYFDFSSSRNDSVGNRKELIKNGLTALFETYGLGVGGGASLAVQERVGGVGGSKNLSSMHNFWVEVLVDAGVVFFFCFVLWYFYMSFSLLLIAKKSNDAWLRYHAGAVFLSFCIFSVGCISASSVIYYLPMWLMFGWGEVITRLEKLAVFRNRRLKSSVA